MTARVGMLCGLVMLALATPARAVVLVSPSGAPVGGKWQRWADAAKVPVVDAAVVLATGRCAGHGPGVACTSPVYDGGAISGYRVTLPRRGADPDMRRLLYHELGHVFDWSRMTPATMAAFAGLWRERAPAQDVQSWWWSGEWHVGGGPIAGAGSAVPAEQFAEGYRLCALYGTRWDSAIADGETFAYGYPAAASIDLGTPARLRAWSVRSQRATCRLIAAIASAWSASSRRRGSGRSA